MLVIADGRVQLHGSTPDIVERLDLQPFTGRFEAGVVLTGVVAHHDSRLHLTYVDLAGDRIALPELSHLSAGDQVRLRVRARDVALAISQPVGLSIRNVLRGTLTSIVESPSSGFAEALVQLSGGRIRARLTHAAVEDLALAPGMPVFALVKTVSFEGAA
jgi:molybdate transport system ATP-binding protein